MHVAHYFLKFLFARQAREEARKSRAIVRDFVRGCEDDAARRGLTMGQWVASERGQL